MREAESQPAEDKVDQLLREYVSKSLILQQHTMMVLLAKAVQKPVKDLQGCFDY